PRRAAIRAAPRTFAGTSERCFQRMPYVGTIEVPLSRREFRGRVHETERLSVFLHGLGELGVLLFLLRLDLALHLIAIGNVLHDGRGGGLLDFVVRIVEGG